MPHSDPAATVFGCGGGALAVTNRQLTARAVETKGFAMVRSTARSRGPREPLAAKVPEITLLFWVIKVLTTGMGEAMSDFLGQKSVQIAGLMGVVGILYALRLHLRSTEYRAPVYWFAVMMVAVFGTMAADGVKD